MWLHLALMWLQKRAFLVAVLTIVPTHCAFSQKIAPVLNIFARKCFLLLSYFLSTLTEAGVAVQGPLVLYIGKISIGSQYTL